MTVIIPHQDMELKLINLQRKLIKAISSETSIFYESVPLWLPLPEELNCSSKEHLKNTARNIKSISLDNLKYNNKAIYIEGKLSFDHINGKKADYIISLPFARLYSKSINTNPNIEEEMLKKISLEALPLSLKIFRLGISTNHGNNGTAISDFVWVKLK